ncbi:exo-beta-N-acetylmuramidase NamZ family protein [Reichenbachiella versicolor]|uniref:exo-beta-N-acetylmuramidase NamZ family protein n=1 Tax=Reichenbachiella versicolor TaxID=1821036 RepID=UPI000D6DD0F4|nr:DUF1343 domain-containing protein [Reichenbachiella versicolor]
MRRVRTGLNQLKDFAHMIKGNVGYLCHAASIDHDYSHGIEKVKAIFGSRLKKLYSPQHGIFADVQDNMIESNHFHHDFYDLPVYSLYSETRKPTSEMLEGIDHIIIDLQDVGTRVYTYIYTMIYMMEACSEMGIQVVVLDRPNPVGGKRVAGNILDPKFRSFVGRYPLPMRHGLTVGEIALMAKMHWGVECDLKVIKMKGWNRSQNFWDTKLPWILPSPNLANVETAYTFVATVLFEGTNVSEGRGSTKSLEIVGHPKIKHLELVNELNQEFQNDGLKGFVLRPLSFQPTFQKHTGVTCHGYQIHVTDYKEFKPWFVGQVLMQKLYYHLGDEFSWKLPPYEYEEELLPIDIINGTDKIRKWIESDGSYGELLAIEKEGMNEYLINRKEIMIY